MMKIGILGGSFDPIHEAHISLALDARSQCDLDKVLIIPAKIQPFKADRKVTPAEDRLAMVQLAIAGRNGLEVSDYEIRSDEVSYTYLTMRAIQAAYPDAQLYFITGTDAFLMIEQWRESSEMLARYSYIVGTRPGYKKQELEECMDRIRRDHGTWITNIENIQMDISSTQIRQMLAEGRSVMGLVPACVEQYIREHDLYR